MIKHLLPRGAVENNADIKKGGVTAFLKAESKVFC